MTVTDIRHTKSNIVWNNRWFILAIGPVLLLPASHQTRHVGLLTSAWRGVQVAPQQAAHHQQQQQDPRQPPFQVKAVPVLQPLGCGFVAAVDVSESGKDKVLSHDNTQLQHQSSWVGQPIVPHVCIQRSPPGRVSVWCMILWWLNLQSFETNNLRCQRTGCHGAIVTVWLKSSAAGLYLYEAQHSYDFICVSPFSTSCESPEIHQQMPNQSQ